MKHIMQKKLVRAWLVKFRKKREQYLGYKSQCQSIQSEIRHCFVSWFSNKTLTRRVRLCNKLPVVIADVSLLLYLNSHYMHFLEEDRFRHKWKREMWPVKNRVLCQKWCSDDLPRLRRSEEAFVRCKIHLLSAVHKVMLITHQILAQS